MSAVVIPTARLDLVLQSPEEVVARIEAMLPGERVEVSPEWLAQVRATPAGDPWALSFAVVERATGSVVGGCAFKGPPDADGVVEVAYGTEPSRRGRGYATEAAEALAVFAFASGRVRLVRAHTRLDNMPSARVLEKCKFRRVGAVVDPVDGLVCRWERGPAEPAAPPGPGPASSPTIGG
jgi:RimJ/RimL family protein N-acetyltransferase